MINNYLFQSNIKIFNIDKVSVISLIIFICYDTSSLFSSSSFLSPALNLMIISILFSPSFAPFLHYSNSLHFLPISLPLHQCTPPFDISLLSFETILSILDNSWTQNSFLFLSLIGGFVKIQNKQKSAWLFSFACSSKKFCYQMTSKMPFQEANEKKIIYWNFQVFSICF